MSDIRIRGIGAVSPAGWGAPALVAAIRATEPPLAERISPPGAPAEHFGRRVPTPSPPPPFLRHARLRRASAISHWAVAAALEALGPEEKPPTRRRLGLVMGHHVGCIRYTERFFTEVLADPSTASPLLFPETVFNAPASHVAAVLGDCWKATTLIGDQTVFLQGLTTAAHWLADDLVDLALVISSEEGHWLAADAMIPFSRRSITSEGAGALCLERSDDHPAGIALEQVTRSHPYVRQPDRREASRAMRRELGLPNLLLVDSQCGVERLDRPETEAWRDWTGPVCSPRRMLGESFAAATAWQCVAACAALSESPNEPASACVSTVGSNEGAIGARFVRGTGTVSGLSTAVA